MWSGEKERSSRTAGSAMIGAMGFSAHYMIEGSVPAVIGALLGVVAFSLCGRRASFLRGARRGGMRHTGVYPAAFWGARRRGAVPALPRLDSTSLRAACSGSRGRVARHGLRTSRGDSVTGLGPVGGAPRYRLPGTGPMRRADRRGSREPRAPNPRLQAEGGTRAVRQPPRRRVVDRRRGSLACGAAVSG